MTEREVELVRSAVQRWLTGQRWLSLAQELDYPDDTARRKLDRELAAVELPPDPGYQVAAEWRDKLQAAEAELKAAPDGLDDLVAAIGEYRNATPHLELPNVFLCGDGSGRLERGQTEIFDWDWGQYHTAAARIRAAIPKPPSPQTLAELRAAMEAAYPRGHWTAKERAYIEALERAVEEKP